jgi:hypothetical protein
MKKPLIILLATFAFVSCDYIMKKHDDNGREAKVDKKVVLGTDKDKNGCVLSAGYRWSVIDKECIRPFEEGYRLNPVNMAQSESDSISAFVIFEEKGNRAELYLPGSKEAMMLTKDNTKGPYKNAHWSLHSQHGYLLKKDGTTQYIGAEAIKEGQVTGDSSDQS